MLFTPEQLYPLTGEKRLPLTTSVSQGVEILHNAILNESTPWETASAAAATRRA